MAMYLPKYAACLKCPFYYVGNRLVTELEIDISSYILRLRVVLNAYLTVPSVASIHLRPDG